MLDAALGAPSPLAEWNLAGSAKPAERGRRYRARERDVSVSLPVMLAVSVCTEFIIVTLSPWSSAGHSRRRRREDCRPSELAMAWRFSPRRR